MHTRKSHDGVFLTGSTGDRSLYCENLNLFAPVTLTLTLTRWQSRSYI